MSGTYHIEELRYPEDRLIAFVVIPGRSGDEFWAKRPLIPARDAAVAQMRLWCREQFGPRALLRGEEFASGWFVRDSDSVFSFSDDRLEWDKAFKMRWL